LVEEGCKQTDEVVFDGFFSIFVLYHSPGEKFVYLSRLFLYHTSFYGATKLDQQVK